MCDVDMRRREKSEEFLSSERDTRAKVTYCVDSRRAGGKTRAEGDFRASSRVFLA